MLIWRQISFRMQQPPVYADSQAGEVIQLNPSFSVPPTTNAFGSEGDGPTISAYVYQQQQHYNLLSHPWILLHNNCTICTEYDETSIVSTSTTSHNNQHSAQAQWGCGQSSLNLGGLTAAPPPTWESLNEVFGSQSATIGYAAPNNLFYRLNTSG